MRQREKFQLVYTQEMIILTTHDTTDEMIADAILGGVATAMAMRLWK